MKFEIEKYGCLYSASCGSPFYKRLKMELLIVSCGLKMKLLIASCGLKMKLLTATGGMKVSIKTYLVFMFQTRCLVDWA